MILPDLAERIRWLQEYLRPQDAAFGNGISDWTITAEYVPTLEFDGVQAWGCMGSPASGGMSKLTPEDIVAKRAHIVVRKPKSPDELPEVDRTLLHEGGHILVAPMKSTNRAAEENAMHSLDRFFSKLSPEQGETLARSFQNPMARAYRAKEGSMPEAVDETKKEPDKGVEKPAMQEGAPRDVSAITQDIVKAILAGQPIDELGKELVLAQALAGAAAPITAPLAPPAPTMGMQPEEAFQRGVAASLAKATTQAQGEAVKAYADTVEGLAEDQRAMVRKQSTITDAQALVKTYPRTGQTLGVTQHPQVDPKAVKGERPMARAVREAEESPMLRKVLGIGSPENDGMYTDVPGFAVYIDGTERLNHQRAMHEAKRSKLRGAA